MSRERKRERGDRERRFFLLDRSNFTLLTRSSTIHDERLWTRCVAGRKRLSRKVGKRVNANVSLPARCTSSCYTINRFDTTLPPASDSRLLLRFFILAVRAFRLHFLAVIHLERTKIRANIFKGKKHVEGRKMRQRRTVQR